MPELSKVQKDWPHAPIHRLDGTGVFMVTSATLYKKHLFNSPDKLTLLENALLKQAKSFHWQLEAWAVFPNHYHFIVHGVEETQPGSLGTMLNRLHNETAIELNQLDGITGRNVWYNFWDTKLTYEKSYLARLNYVHQNPVKHGLVAVANQYRWCSAAWFEGVATPAMVKTIYSFKTDSIKVYDDF
ncbi:MAG TPA: transposase [Blastocatellia bacterium]|nr:transposase [Blastocatellia bacterium]HMX27993.1 transposase [Blastocatellia bacterium]HMZ20093.1 transposase [Blastocatellia bacterium]HNG29274.1 transposase [Blastocatellia bacterium]